MRSSGFRKTVAAAAQACHGGGGGEIQEGRSTTRGPVFESARGRICVAAAKRARYNMYKKTRACAAAAARAKTMM